MAGPAPAPLETGAGAVAIGAPQPLASSTLFVTRPPEVELRLAEIVVTPAEVRGRYVFGNVANRDIGALATFTAPDLDAGSPEFGYLAIPLADDINFMGFSASVDEQEATPLGVHQVFGAGLDRTALLEEAQVPAQPAASDAWRSLRTLRPSAVNDLYVAGLIDLEPAGDRLEPRPRWLLKSAWYWPQAFPAGAQTVIAWRHRLSAAATARPLNGPGDESRRARYCAGEAARAATRAASGNGAGLDWIREVTASLRINPGPAHAGPARLLTVTIDAGDSGLAPASCFAGLQQVKPGMWRARRENALLDETLSVMFLAPGHGAADGPPPDDGETLDD